MVPKRNYSALDMPAHLKLKERAPAQEGIPDFKQELLRKERELERKKLGLPPLEEEEEHDDIAAQEIAAEDES